ncbi:CHAT domain-containing protein [Beggiatoa leptomitoformis]|uniref:CHAT domain-containing protein n=1 Tax=Beggiatoa leptomitoformis TaxID=288004 RepID=A0A2N9YGQ6_9GAMM|nr:CHAT domain-containing protein [Beggiatoa leptomitoformis]ALG68034.1 CHAT domain-containing protein [Beggiatoa leptomitoformis]AUI69677.1 CHAT domain-containing protein [Beggiatoa leptomitoformis]
MIFAFILIVNTALSPFVIGQQAFQQGQYAEAIQQWKSALDISSDNHEQVAIMIQLIKAYRQLGNYNQAIELVEQALKQGSELFDIPLKINLYNEISKLNLAQGIDYFKKASQYNTQALVLARQLNDVDLLAEVLNQSANLFSANLDFETALKNYTEAIELLRNKGGDSRVLQEMQTKILINKAQKQFLLEKETIDQFDTTEEALQHSLQLLETALQQTNHWQDQYSEIFALISLGKLAQALRQEFPAESVAAKHLLQQAYQALYRAQQLANTLHNAYAQAYADGSLGELYQSVAQNTEALQLFRQAVFHAQQTQENTLLYLWLWKLGHLLRQQELYKEAIDIYRAAIAEFTPVQQQIATKGYCAITDSIRERVAPVYFELADLLLKQAKQETDTQRQTTLIEARQAIETYKNFELQDYYQDSCITQQTECTSADQLIDSHTAILYLIPLVDRLELLLTTTTGIHQATVAVTEKNLHDTVSYFSSPLRDNPQAKQRIRGMEEANSSRCEPLRLLVEDTMISSPPASFFEYAQRLHQWLIAPFTQELHNIDTLIIVPEGILRTLPFAALHDGKNYLVEQFALGITPSLCLNNAQEHRVKNKILLSGLSDSVQNFSALPCTKYEVETIQQLYSSPPPLLNKDFSIPKLRSALSAGDYSIVHIASHGQFNKQLNNTFILTYDDRLNLSQLNDLMTLARVNNTPIELLTLSACETAMGDDRAALGLAGVALKAGVKSALASLWKVDDEATPLVLIEFYTQLQPPHITKAKALQLAQKRMITDKKYRYYHHPYYWAAFLLIGGWL